jgi:hypothetical protein
LAPVVVCVSIGPLQSSETVLLCHHRLRPWQHIVITAFLRYLYTAQMDTLMPFSVLSFIAICPAVTSQLLRMYCPMVRAASAVIRECRPFFPRCTRLSC